MEIKEFEIITPSGLKHIVRKSVGVNSSVVEKTPDEKIKELESEIAHLWYYIMTMEGGGNDSVV